MSKKNRTTNWLKRHTKDPFVKQSQTVGTVTIASSDNAAIIGPASVAGTLTVAGNVRVL